MKPITVKIIDPNIDSNPTQEVVEIVAEAFFISSHDEEGINNLFVGSTSPMGFIEQAATITKDLRGMSQEISAACIQESLAELSTHFDNPKDDLFKLSEGTDLNELQQELAKGIIDEMFDFALETIDEDADLTPFGTMERTKSKENERGVTTNDA